MRKRTLNTLLLGISAVLFSAGPLTASAATTGGALAQVDTNHDGMISEQEWMNAAKVRFDKLDTNHDGVLEPQELQQARDDVRQRLRSLWQQRGVQGTTP